MENSRILGGGTILECAVTAMRIRPGKEEPSDATFFQTPLLFLLM
jgi:hypothetical protein